MNFSIFSSKKARILQEKHEQEPQTTVTKIYLVFYTFYYSFNVTNRKNVNQGHN